ncbi:MAG: hypothetical protein M1835_002995, partial [Candelina submexicana]
SASSSISPSDTSSTSPSPSTTPSSTPPIITYPEFLHPQPPPSPPPLITTSQILSTFYLFSSLSLTIYGASKYIVTPMLTNLTSARQELATTASTNLTTLNQKLSTLVSEIPSSVTSPHSKSKEGKEGDEDSDAESETSDPNELFHRDYGTQTSPSLSRHRSLSTTSSTSSPQSPPTPLTAQESRLSTIRSHLSELLSDHTSQLSTSEEVSTRVQDLTTYLDGLHYSSSYYSSAGIYGGAIGGAGLGGVGATAGGGEDMVAKLKAEIRGVKGVLLSARNFPGGGGRVVGRVGD